jgi:hypothetical protein
MTAMASVTRKIQHDYDEEFYKKRRKFENSFGWLNLRTGSASPPANRCAGLLLGDLNRSNISSSISINES